MVIFDRTKMIMSCSVGSLVKAAPTTSANIQDVLLVVLDDMGSVQNLRELVAARIAGKVLNCIYQRMQISMQISMPIT